MNLGDGDTLLKAEPVHGDHVAVAGTNRKLLISRWPSCRCRRGARA